jgi:hypothetical protein
MITFAGLFVGFLFGLAAGRQEMHKRIQRRLREFFAARQVRAMDGSGVDVPLEDLIDALRKDVPAQLAPAPGKD